MSRSTILHRKTSLSSPSNLTSLVSVKTAVLLRPPHHDLPRPLYNSTAFLGNRSFSGVAITLRSGHSPRGHGIPKKKKKIPLPCCLKTLLNWMNCIQLYYFLGKHSHFFFTTLLQKFGRNGYSNVIVK